MALENGKSYTYHYDGMGNTTELTDSTGAVTDTYRYNAWGEVISRTGTTKNPHTFVGKERYYAVPEATLYLLGFRYFSATAARFPSIDPKRVGVNWYIYVESRPASHADAYGLGDTSSPCHGGPGEVGTVIGGPWEQAFWLTAFGGDYKPKDPEHPNKPPELEPARTGWLLADVGLRAVAVHANLSGTRVPSNDYDKGGIWRLKWQNRSTLRRQDWIWHEFDVPCTDYRRVALDTGNRVTENDHLDVFLSHVSDADAVRIYNETFVPCLKQLGSYRKDHGRYYVTLRVYKCQGISSEEGMDVA